MLRALRPWLLALCTVTGIGCSAQPSTQVLTGRITTSGALAVRAVSGTEVVTAARVRSDGSFSLSLPAGDPYRLELLTTSGVRQVLARHGSALDALAFRVCQPTQPFDCGSIGDGDGSGSGSGATTCDATDGTCACVALPDGTTDCGPMCEVLADGTTNCGAPSCDPTTDPSCPCVTDSAGNTECAPPPPPPPCDPTQDPMCPCTIASDGTTNCPSPCDPTTDPTCACTTGPDGTTACGSPGCDPMTDPTCPVPLPPCNDPADPDSCQDPCMTDPSQCGCTTMASDSAGNPDGTATGGSCWPPPAPPMCDSAGNCDPTGVAPQHPPGDFGCAGT